MSKEVISIQVDVGYAFDYLSILSVKHHKGLIPEKTFDDCRLLLSFQLGAELFKNIFDSKEFASLYEVNARLFNAVDLARQDKVSAKAVDDLNTQRFKLKQQIHEKFFEGSEMLERKNA